MAKIPRYQELAKGDFNFSGISGVYNPYDTIVQNWDRAIASQVPAIEQSFQHRDHNHQIHIGRTQELNQDMLGYIERERIR